MSLYDELQRERERERIEENLKQLAHEQRMLARGHTGTNLAVLAGFALLLMGLLGYWTHLHNACGDKCNPSDYTLAETSRGWMCMCVDNGVFRNAD